MVRACHGNAPGVGRFGGVCRPNHRQTGNGTQTGQMLHRLVGWSVFADGDTVMRKHINNRQPHQGRQPDGRPHVVGKHQERAAIRFYAAMQCHTRHDGRHGMFADPEADVAAFVAVFLKFRGFVEIGLVGRRQIGRPAHQRVDSGSQRVEDRSRCGAGRHRPVARFKGRHVGVPIFRQSTVQSALQRFRQIRMPGAISIHQPLPGGFSIPAPFERQPEAGLHTVRYTKFSIFRASQAFFGQTDFFFAQRCPMRIGRSGLVGASVSDLGFQHDQGGTLLFLSRRIQCGGDGLGIVAVFNGLHMPVAGVKASVHIFGEGNIGTSLDGYPVVVIHDDQTCQAEMAGQGSRLGRKPFHEIPITTHDIGVVIDDGGVRPVEAGRQVTLRHGHAHGVGKPLAERTGGRLHARGMTVFGMPRRLAAPLPKVFQIIEAQVITGQMKQTIQQHRGMTARKDKPIPIDPLGIGRIVLQVLRPEDIGRRGESHRSTGMPGIGLLDRVHGKRSNGVDAHGVEIFQTGRPTFCHFNHLPLAKAVIVRSRVGADPKSIVSISDFPASNMSVPVRCLWCGKRHRATTTDGRITAIGALESAS